jgi:ribosomal protein L4
LIGKKLLFVLPEADKNVYLSARNLQRTEVMTASALNTYKVLNADVLVVTENSLKNRRNLNKIKGDNRNGKYNKTIGH